MKDLAISSENQSFIDLAYTIGFFLGDGSLSVFPYKSSVNGKTYANHVTAFGCMDLEPIQRCRRQLKRVWGHKYAINERRLKSGVLFYEMKSQRRDVFDYFSFNTSLRTEVPRFYFGTEVDKEIKREVLRGLMDSDGYASAREYTTRQGKKSIRYDVGFASGKKTLINNAAALMLQIGITANKIGLTTKREYDPIFRLQPNTRSFLDAGMFFYAKRKQAKLDQYIERMIGPETLRATPSTKGEDIVQP